MWSWFCCFVGFNSQPEKATCSWLLWRLFGKEELTGPSITIIIALLILLVNDLWLASKKSLRSRPREHNLRDMTHDNDIKKERVLVSLKTIADMVDTTRSSVRRWLREAGISPVAIGRGRKGAIRYQWQDIKAWLERLERTE